MIRRPPRSTPFPTRRSSDLVAAGRLQWRAGLTGALLTPACLSGFLQGVVLFLSLPPDLGAPFGGLTVVGGRSEEHTSELQLRQYLLCRPLLQKKKKKNNICY